MAPATLFYRAMNRHPFRLIADTKPLIAMVGRRIIPAESLAENLLRPRDDLIHTTSEVSMGAPTQCPEGAPMQHGLLSGPFSGQNRVGFDEEFTGPASVSNARATS